MLSTGNDIVSIAAINVTRTQEPVFYKKILSESEILQYHQKYNSLVPFVSYVWLLWSIKESAYKYLQRFDPELVFSPTKFVVNELICPSKSYSSAFEELIKERCGFDDGTFYTARVTHLKNTIWAKSVIYPDMMHSIVHHVENFSSVNWGIRTIPDTDPKSQSEAVRVFLLEKLKTVFIGRQLSVSKNEHGVPVLFQGQKQIPVPISFSHHKHFIAYSFVSDNG